MTKPGEYRERKRGVYCDRMTFTPFPVGNKRDRVFSLPEVLQPSYSQDRNANSRYNTITTRNTRSFDLPTEPSRRHSWSSGTNYNSTLPMISSVRKISHDSSRLSSSHSIPEVIEECSTDDEVKSTMNSMDSGFDSSETSLSSSGTDNIENEFLRCRNCFQKDRTVLIVKSDNYPYCKKCRDLLRNKNKYGNMIPFSLEDLRKASSASPCDLAPLSSSPPRRCRKASVPELTTDLPCIEEPSAGEEGTDTKELQLIVEREVNKLLNFGTSTTNVTTSKNKPTKGLFCHHPTSMHERRKNSDNNELDLITADLLTSVLIHNNMNPIK